MKLELIKTSRYLLAVDDSKINVNDWFYLDDANVIAKYIDADPVKEALKIIAYLPLNDSPILEGVPLLPPLEVEDDVESMSYNPSLEYKKMYDDANTFDFRKGFVEGYNKAKESERNNLTPFKNLIVLIENGLLKGTIETNLIIDQEISICKEYLNKLSQPKTPTHFEFEMEAISKIVDNTWKDYKSIKTITNTQGQQVACGKYIY